MWKLIFETVLSISGGRTVGRRSGSSGEMCSRVSLVIEPIGIVGTRMTKNSLCSERTLRKIVLQGKSTSMSQDRRHRVWKDTATTIEVVRKLETWMKFSTL